MTPGRSHRLYAWCLAWLLALGALSAGAQQASPREYQVKAVFLYNFTQFVEWPPAAFEQPTSPLTIGVVGHDPFGPFLDDLVRGERIGDRPIAVRRFRDAGEVKNCHILFISNGPQLERILRALRGKPVLTVSDAPSFINKGGMVRLFTEANKVRLQINPAAARAANIHISSKLLRVAEVVE